MNFWLKPSQCTGCGACQNICPKKAIVLEPDNCGFSHPKIDNNLCIDCKLCVKVCPVMHPVTTKNTDSPTIYAGWSLNDDTRYHSTSGGLFSELADSIFDEGGVVFGAVYDENHLVYHTGVSNREDLCKIRQSKYIQSETRYSFKQAKMALEQGKKVAFCGTPCQIAGLYTYLGKDYENLCTIDFICRGSNSPKAYRKWLDMLEKKYGAKATRVWFKNKELGWNCFSTRVDFANGKKYRQDRYHDLFMRGYLEKNLYIRPSCTQCAFKGLPRPADLTLADFWKIEKHLDADRGTSMLVVNSERGKELVEKTAERVFLTERTFEEALAGNQMLTTSAWGSKWSTHFLTSLDNTRFDIAFYKLSIRLKYLKWKTARLKKAQAKSKKAGNK